MTPDDKKDDDHVIEVEGFDILVDESLYESIIGEIKIDYKESGLRRGFQIYR